MAANQRIPAEIMRDRALVADLYLKGWSQTSIAERFHRSQESVSYDLGKIRKEWRESRIRDFDALQAAELEKIDNLERTYWDAWERSLKDRETSSQEQKTGMNAGQSAKFRRQGSQGNPAFLAGIERCIQMRCKLLGLNAPENINAHVTAGDDPARNIDERMARYAELFGGRAIVVDSTARDLDAPGARGGGGRRLEADQGALPAGEIRPPAGDGDRESLDSPRPPSQAG